MFGTKKQKKEIPTEVKTRRGLVTLGVITCMFIFCLVTNHKSEREEKIYSNTVQKMDIQMDSILTSRFGENGYHNARALNRPEKVRYPNPEINDLELLRSRLIMENSLVRDPKMREVIKADSLENDSRIREIGRKLDTLYSKADYVMVRTIRYNTADSLDYSALQVNTTDLKKSWLEMEMRVPTKREDMMLSKDDGTGTQKTN